MALKSFPITKNILHEVEKELKEGAEEIDLLRVDVQGLASMINEYDIKMFDTTEHNICTILRTIIEKTSSLNSFFMIDIGAIFRRYKLWKKNLPNVEMFYAVKCNPDRVLLNALSDLGVGFDVASKVEISMVKELDVSSDMIIFANPVKEISHITYAESHNIMKMTFDNEDELKKISVFHPKAELVLRILVDDSKSKMPFGSKFGCPKQNLDNVFSLAERLSLNIIGVSFHVGSSCFDPNTYQDAIMYSREVFNLAEKYGFKMKLLDIGGGFPGHDSIESDEKFIEIANIINKSLEKYFNDYCMSDLGHISIQHGLTETKPELRVIAEPGRFFATSCGTLVTNVIGKKLFHVDENKIIHYYINSNTYGLFNNIIFDKAIVELKLVKGRLSKEEELVKSVIFGQTCDSLDRIMDDIYLPELSCGNWLYVPNHGAYTLASASTFNGFELADVKYVFTF